MPSKNQPFCPLRFFIISIKYHNFIHVVILLDLNLWTTMCKRKIQESTKTKTLGHSSLMVQKNNKQIPHSYSSLTTPTEKQST